MVQQTNINLPEFDNILRNYIYNENKARRCGIVKRGAETLTLQFCIASGRERPYIHKMKW